MDHLKNHIMKWTAGGTALHGLMLVYGDKITQSLDLIEVSLGDVSSIINALIVALAGIWSVQANKEG